MLFTKEVVLGRIISQARVEVDPIKIEVIKKIPIFIREEHKEELRDSHIGY